MDERDRHPSRNTNSAWATFPPLAWAAVFLCVAWILWSCFRLVRYKNNYPSVSFGQSVEKVRALLGSPSEVRQWDKRVEFHSEWRELHDASNVETVYVYSSPFPWVMPEEWNIGFDNEGRVLARQDCVSP